MSKPLIGLTPGHNTESQDIFMRPTYMEALSAAGAIPVVLPLTVSQEDCGKLAETFDGFLFTGGPDPHPFLFGQETHRNCGNISLRRDTMETALLSAVMKTGKPVLGICRGIQLLNAALGGTNYQDLLANGFEQHTILVCGRNEGTHCVQVERDSVLYHIFQCEQLEVNSFHHQAVRVLAPCLEAMAHSEDGVVEAVRVKDHPFAVATQWHPEMMFDSDQQLKLATAFVQACQAGRG